MKWMPGNTAPKGAWKDKEVTINGKKTIRSVFDPHWVLLALNGKIYFSHFLSDGRVNGWTKEQKPSHWMEVHQLPSEVTT